MCLEAKLDDLDLDLKALVTEWKEAYLGECEVMMYWSRAAVGFSISDGKQWTQAGFTMTILS